MFLHDSTFVIALALTETSLLKLRIILQSLLEPKFISTLGHGGLLPEPSMTYLFVKESQGNGACDLSALHMTTGPILLCLDHIYSFLSLSINFLNG